MLRAFMTAILPEDEDEDDTSSSGDEGGQSQQTSTVGASGSGSRAAMRFPGPPPKYAEVALSVYELHWTSSVGKLVGKLLHVGIEVYWLEWSYGAGDSGTGIFPCMPGQSTLGTFMERVLLGRTAYTPEGVIRILKEMQPNWRSQEYNVFARNCQAFCVTFAKRLECDPVPEWVLATLRKFGEDPELLSQMEAQAKRHSIDSATARLAVIDDHKVSELAGKGDAEAAKERNWRQAKAYIRKKAIEAERGLRSIDFSVEFSYSSQYAPLAREMSRNADFADLVLRITAQCTDTGTQEASLIDWVELVQCEALPGSRFLVEMTLHSSPFAPEDWKPDRPSLEYFAPQFRRQLLVPLSSQSWSAEVSDWASSFTVITAPGMARFGRRAETQAGPGPALHFTPLIEHGLGADRLQLHRSVLKLQELKKRAAAIKR